MTEEKKPFDGTWEPCQTASFASPEAAQLIMSMMGAIIELHEKVEGLKKQLFATSDALTDLRRHINTNSEKLNIPRLSASYNPRNLSVDSY